MSPPATVLVTGASGFIAQHTILQLLAAGYHVRGTLRSLAKAPEVTAVLRQHVSDPAMLDRLTLCAADLSADEGWREAVRGCRYVVHMASPLPNAPPEHEDELIGPARDGALRVLRACAALRAEGEGPARVVLTSSVAAVLYGLARDGSKVYDERDWSELGPKVGAYEKSKTLAERAAWDYVATLLEKERFELCTINPGLVLGPVLSSEVNTSAELVRKLLRRELPGCPPVGWAVVDVRDVAKAHVDALTAPGVDGKRFIVAIEHADMLDVAKILAQEYGPRGYRVPTGKIPAWLMKIVALWDKTARLAVQELGLRQDVSTKAARETLGFAPRSLREMVTAMADSLITYKVVAPKV